MFYLDNAATTKPNEELLKKSANIYIENFGNPSSLHDMGLKSEKIIKKVRTEISNYLSVKSSELYFTSGGTESNNMAIKGVLDIKESLKNKNIITTKSEHKSIINTFKEYEKKGLKIKYLDLDQSGKISIKELSEKIDSNTLLISLTHVNSETGLILDIYSIGKHIKSINSNIVFHVDMVQSYLKLNIDLKYIDLASFSAHKVKGLKAIGFLYKSDRLKLKPLINGGFQENNLRAGTENLLGIINLGLITEYYKNDLESRYKNIDCLKNKFIKELSLSISDSRPLIEKENTSPYILSYYIRGIKSEVLLHYLEKYNIYLSTGSACSSKDNISHVLKSIDIDNDMLESIIRISFFENINEEDLIFIVNKIKDSTEKIRKIMKRY